MTQRPTLAQVIAPAMLLIAAILRIAAIDFHRHSHPAAACHSIRISEFPTNASFYLTGDHCGRCGREASARGRPRGDLAPDRRRTVQGNPNQPLGLKFPAVAGRIADKNLQPIVGRRGSPRQSQMNPRLRAGADHPLGLRGGKIPTRQPRLLAGQGRIEQGHADIAGRIDDVAAEVAGLDNHQQPLVARPAAGANSPRKCRVQRDLGHRAVIGQGRNAGQRLTAGRAPL